MFTNLATRGLMGALATLLLAGGAQAGIVPLGPHAVPIHSAPYGGAPHSYGGSVQTWVPGHYKKVRNKVWIQGASVQVWIAPVYEQRCDPFGVLFQVLVQPGHFVIEQQPGHFQTVLKSVYVPAHFEVTYKPVHKPVFHPATWGHKKGSKFGGYGG